jgi:hypothetical protein
LYNPYSNNDDNRILWDSDDYVIGLVPNDGDEVKVRYEDIVSINKNPNYMIDGGSLGSQYVLIKSIGNYGMGTVSFLVSKKELNKIPFDTIQEKAEAFVNNKEDNFGEKSYRFDKLITNSKEIDDYAKGYNHSNYKVVLSNDEENYPDGFYITKSKDYLKFKDGGKTTFDEKATAIAKNFEGKKVKPKYQKEYGKTYDKAEAKEVGKRVAGSLKAKYDSKMSGGGGVSFGGKNPKIKKYSVYIEYGNDNDNEMKVVELDFTSFKEAYKVYKQYSKSDKYKGEDIIDMMILKYYENGDFEPIENNYSKGGYVEITDPKRELFNKGYAIYGGDSWEKFEDVKKIPLPKGAFIVKVKTNNNNYFAIAEKRKMATSGSTKRKPKTASNNTMVLAKQIRKEGESWASALKRAKEQIRK